MLTLAFTAAMLATAGLPARGDAPSPACLDARAVTSVRQIAPDQLLVATASARHRVQLSEACAGATQDSALLAKDGWVCGAPREFLKTADGLCPIATVTPISDREFASLARSVDEALSAGATLLDPVEARGQRSAKTSFRGSFDYCVRPSALRGWFADIDGIVVTVGKRRSGGNERYRIEFASSCPEATTMDGLTLRSGVGGDLICGHAGDVALLSAADPIPDPEAPLTFMQAASTGVRCHIAAVYPVD